ncbi:MAG: UBP-type zinc finger domain-containing protein [Nitrososphaera sp.]|nr:UBP-type zinc finger domain-containing protein [Nitrososphaera sp.]
MGLKTLETATEKELANAILRHHTRRALDRTFTDDISRQVDTVPKIYKALEQFTFSNLPSDPLMRSGVCLGFEIGASVIAILNENLVLQDAPNVWRCFHCGLVFDDREQAKEHFGSIEDMEPPDCISTKHPLVVKLRERIRYLEEKLAVNAHVEREGP